MTFWVIERNDIPWGNRDAGVTLYFALRAGVSWDERIEQALQFARQTDARTYHIKHLANDPALRVVEHAMIGLAPSQGTRDTEGWKALSCDEQFALAERIASNVGYVLTPEAEHPDNPHARAAAPPSPADGEEALPLPGGEETR